MRRFVEVVEWLFRHLVAYPFLRLLFHNRYSDALLDLQSVKKVLILRFDRIGDMIVTTPVFQILKERNPALHIGVFTSPANAEIVQHNRHVDAIYRLQRHWWDLLREIRKVRNEDYDVVLNFIFNRTTSAGILANLAAPRGFKVGQGAEKYRFYFNRLLRLERTEFHMVEVLAYFVEQVFSMTIPREELRFEIAIDNQSRSGVDIFLKKYRLMRRQENNTARQRYIVLNISATDSVRKISQEQALGLAKHLTAQDNFSVVLNCAPTERGTAEHILREVNSSRCCLFLDNGIATLLQLASLIEGAVCVFTPDTSIIHFASAMNTPVLGFFTPLQMAHEWVPYNVRYSALYAPSGMPVSAIPLFEIINHVDDFLATLQKAEFIST